MKKMSKVINTDERIANIKANRKKLLSMVRSTINNNKLAFSGDIKDLANVLEADENAEKKYIEIIKIRALIEDIAHKIMQTSDKEEIENLRKELNKAISKVRKEVKNRNIDPNKIESDISGLRKDISKYIRVVKRVDTLNAIDDFNGRKDNLSEEERKEFRKLLNRERSYNKRSIDDLNNKKEVKVDNKDGFVLSGLKIKKASPTPCLLESAIDDEDFVSRKVSEYNRMYHIERTHSYGKSVPSNVINFIKNIPINIRNKKQLKRIYYELNFTKNPALIGYVEYQRENNSISNGFRSLLSKSSLYSDEYLDSHNRCVNWILDFCREHNMGFFYAPAKSL